MNALFEFGKNYIEVANFKHYPEDAANANPYNSGFNLYVLSGDFMGIGECEYDIKEFRRFVSELEEMYEFKRYSVELSEICYGAKIIFEMNRTGQINVSGTIYGSCMLHSMTFEFEADQTALPPFIKQLREILERYDRSRR